MIPIWSFLILETDPTGPVGLHPSLGYFALPYISKWANPYRRPRVGSPNRRSSLWVSFRARRAAALQICRFQTCLRRFAANVAGSLNAP